MDGWMDGWTSGCVDGWMGMWTDGWMDGWMDGWAVYLRGKHKPYYTPHVDCGDFVVIINASKVRFSGSKLDNKQYFTHSGYFGSTKSKTLGEMLNKSPEKLFRLAVRGMLPKTKLGKIMIKKLKVYSGESHPHTAQTNKKQKKD